MAKVILLIEDTPEEAKIALELLKEKGIKFLWAQTYDQARVILSQVHVTAILTDLFFPERKGQDATIPCGISIAIEAKMNGIPVGICTRVNHHSCEYLWKAWMALQIPVSETKDWKAVIDELLTKE